MVDESIVVRIEESAPDANPYSILAGPGGEWLGTLGSLRGG